MTSEHDAAQTRILLVEDSFIVGCDVKRQVERLGHTVVGPVPDCAAAIAVLRRTPVDGALLDITLANGETSESIARELRTLGVPYAFLTGHAEPASLLPPELKSTRVLKPIDGVALRAALDEMFTTRV